MSMNKGGVDSLLMNLFCFREAGCNPLSAGILSDLFAEVRWCGGTRLRKNMKMKC